MKNRWQIVKVLTWKNIYWNVLCNKRLVKADQHYKYKQLSDYVKDFKGIMEDFCFKYSTQYIS